MCSWHTVDVVSSQGGDERRQLRVVLSNALDQQFAATAPTDQHTKNAHAMVSGKQPLWKNMRERGTTSSSQFTSGV